MYDATAETGSLIVNIKTRVANRGPLKGQRHPYVYELVLALQHMGWRWIETYIWAKPNAVPGRFGPRTKDSFEYVYHFARGPKPHFDLNTIRVPYKATAGEIERRKLDRNGRRNTEAGFGRDRTKTYLNGGADPGNVVVPQTYNQHKGVAHTAAMPEGLAEFFVRAASPAGGLVIDPFAGGGTTVVVAPPARPSSWGDRTAQGLRDRGSAPNRPRRGRRPGRRAPRHGWLSHSADRQGDSRSDQRGRDLG